MQIQPSFLDIDRYAPLYEKEGLFFEILELSFFFWDEVDFERAVEWYKQSNRVKSLHGYFIDVNPASADPSISDYSKKACEKSCQTANRIGAQNVVFHSSCYPNLRGVYMDRWAKISGAFFSELADKYNLNLFIENCADVDPGPIKKLLSEAKNPKVKACLDTGHALLTRTPMEKWFEELFEYIGYVHLSDNMGLFDDHMPLGEGTLNIKLIDDYCRKLPKDTPATLEVGGIAEITRSIEYIKKTGYFEYFL